MVKALPITPRYDFDQHMSWKKKVQYVWRFQNICNGIGSVIPVLRTGGTVVMAPSTANKRHARARDDRDSDRYRATDPRETAIFRQLYTAPRDSRLNDVASYTTLHRYNTSINSSSCLRTTNGQQKKNTPDVPTIGPPTTLQAKCALSYRGGHLLLPQNPEVVRRGEEHHLLQVGEAELVMDLHAHLYRVDLWACRRVRPTSAPTSATGRQRTGHEQDKDVI